MYRHFLRNPDTVADDIHLLLHMHRETTELSLKRAIRLGLLHQDDITGRITPTDPETAVTRLVDTRLHELHTELRRVTRTRPVIEALQAERGVASEARHGIEQLVNPGQIRDRLADLAFFTREEILSVEPYAALRPENIEHSRPLDSRCLQRQVVIRQVVLREALNDPVSLAYLCDLAEQGAQVRVADNVTERLLVYDRSTALVPLDPRDSSRGALLAHEGALVANLVALFDKIWEQAERLEVVVAELADPSTALSETERQVLHSMCTAGKDETAARGLGVSVRTYRRHVADLMGRLGAVNRAQAALKARERGWI